MTTSMRRISLQIFSLSVVLLPSACKPLSEPCPEATFYVRSGATGGTGTSAQPFGTIAQAIAAAPSVQDSCEVITVYLEAGSYNENVTLARGLQLIGKGANTIIHGKVENLSGHDLYLEQVKIQGAPSYGVLQSGGILEMRSVTVTQTVANANDLASGTGILIKGGADANLTFVNSTQNQGQGLAATDLGTTVKVGVTTISGNQVNPLARTQFANNETHVGAVEARRGARLSIQTLTLEDNIGFGVMVSHGGRAFLKGGAIRRTQDVNFGHGNISANAAVAHQSELEMQDVTLDHSFVGVIASQGFLTMIGGQVTNNEIGASFGYADLRAIAPGYDPTQCIDNVSFVGNGRPADFQDLLPLPPGPGVTPTIPAPFCRRVPPL